MDTETVGSKKTLKIDGIVRTVVNGPISTTHGIRLVFGPMEGKRKVSSFLLKLKLEEFSILIMNSVNQFPDCSKWFYGWTRGPIRMYFPEDKGLNGVTFADERGNPEIRFDSSIGANPKSSLVYWIGMQHLLMTSTS
jgi:hypothetical protein